MNIEQLNAEHAIAGFAEFDKGKGGLPRLTIRAKQAQARIYLHGAHVCDYRPVDGEPVLWLSEKSRFEPDSPIRGGVPVCFPWFGSHDSDPSLPAHGFARHMEWRVDSVESRASGAVSARFILESDDKTRQLWPFDFRIVHTVTVDTRLAMNLAVTNTSSEEISFTEALHTYFSISDIRNATVHGLEGKAFVDTVGGRTETRESEEPIRFAGETDSLYMNAEGTCSIQDPGLGRRIRIEKSGSNSTVVWNPWIGKASRMPDFGDDEWPLMLCVETANAGANRVNLRPGDSHVMEARISVA